MNSAKPTKLEFEGPVSPGVSEPSGDKVDVSVLLGLDRDGHFKLLDALQDRLLINKDFGDSILSTSTRLTDEQVRDILLNEGSVMAGNALYDKKALQEQKQSLYRHILHLQHSLTAAQQALQEKSDCVAENVLRVIEAGPAFAADADGKIVYTSVIDTKGSYSRNELEDLHAMDKQYLVSEINRVIGENESLAKRLRYAKDAFSANLSAVREEHKKMRAEIGGLKFALESEKRTCKNAVRALQEETAHCDEANGKIRDLRAEIDALRVVASTLRSAAQRPQRNHQAARVKAEPSNN